VINLVYLIIAGQSVSPSLVYQSDIQADVVVAGRTGALSYLLGSDLQCCRQVATPL